MCIFHATLQALIMQNVLHCWGGLLIHSADPQSRPVVIIVFTHVIRTSVRSHFSKSSKAKQISNESNVHYWPDCGSGRVVHWWHLSCSFCLSIPCLQAAKSVKCHMGCLALFSKVGRFSKPNTHYYLGTFFLSAIYDYHRGHFKWLQTIELKKLLTTHHRSKIHFQKQLSSVILSDSPIVPPVVIVLISFISS